MSQFINRFSLITYYFLCVNFLSAQEYVWPTDAGKSLISNFGEFRDGHFHMGLDIRTGGVEGALVFAISDGFVWRMVTNFKGYGKALYIMHPDSSVSVYAHLSKFNPQLESFLQNLQITNESYMVNKYFTANKFPVKKGDEIGYTGNTGYSYGPHLHFEIRNEKEQPMNPQIHGFEIDDRLSPKLEELAVIPLTNNSRINGSALPVQIPFFRKPDGQYVLADTVNSFGEIGFAVKTVDKRQGTSGKFQLKSLDLIIDGTKEYALNYDLLDYSQSDRVQLVRNHRFYRLNLGSFHNLYRSKNLPKSTIQPKSFTGNLNLPPGYHTFEIIARDGNGNTSKGTGIVFVHPPLDMVIQNVVHSGNEIQYFIQSKFLNIPLKSITCYSFTPSGFADKKLTPIRITKKDGGLLVVFDKKTIRNRSFQFIGKNIMGAFSNPLHWHPANLKVDYNAKPKIDITQTESGIMVQVETGKMGNGVPTAFLTTEKKLKDISLNQILPFTYLSNSLPIKYFQDVSNIGVKINNGIQNQYNFSFKPGMSISGQKTFVFSEDQMCSLQSLESSFYDSTLLWIDVIEKPTHPPHGEFLSNVYQLQPFEMPLQEDVRIGIRYDKPLMKLDKLSIYYFDKKEGWTFIPSENMKKKKVITASLSSLEAVCILIDDVSPVIKNTFPAEGGQYYFQDVLRLTVHVDDALAGIEPDESSFSFLLDENKLLAAFQPVNQTISYTLTNPLTAGRHSMSISVRDRSGNETNKKVTFSIK